MTDVTVSQVLVVVEHDLTGFSDINLRVMGAVGRLREFAALQVDLLVAGKACGEVAKASARMPGIRQVLLVDDANCEHQLPEALAPLVAALAADYDYVFIGATTFGKNLLPRVAALMDIQPITDVVAIASPDEFTRPVYAGSGLAHVRNEQGKTLLSIRASAFSGVQIAVEAAPVVALAAPPAQQLSRVISQHSSTNERPELASARVVVSGGRGLQSREQFQLIYRLADKLGAAVGASRAAVDAGFAANEMQVGQTGKIVAPALYVAVGLSGAVQHLAGMRDSQVVVAINKDPDAPIFQVADYGLVADLFEVLPELIELL
jgi:electron transfer flavoprotein alpha subunit